MVFLVKFVAHMAIGTMAMLMAPGLAGSSQAAPPAGSLEVVVGGAAGSQAANARAVITLGGQVGAHLDLINGFEARVPLVALPTLAGLPEVRALSPNRVVKPLSLTYSPTTDTGSLYNTTVITGARKMWSAGYTGKGVDVALIDTGVAPVQGLTGSGKVVYGADLSWESQLPGLAYLDTYGHGTHMAGIIGGRDQVETPAGYAADNTSFLGMAPDARILSVKTADAHGVSDVTQVIAALDWVVQHRHDNGLNVRVINLSYGTDGLQLYATDPLAYAVEQAWFQGIAVIVAGGNDGVASLGLANPARDPFVIAVGAADTEGTDTTSDDRVASFSDYGNVARDPDLIAPGVHIESLRDPGSFIDQTYGATASAGTRYFRGSGTSQAAAVTTGAAALLFQQRPSLTPDQLKYLLTSTAQPLSLLTLSLDPAQGHGELNLAGAMKASLPLWGTGQLNVPATGLGSVELARGSKHAVLNGVALTGEQDIFVHGINTGQLASMEAAGNSWTGGTWNGNSWTGNSWSGNSWTGNSWTGNSWTGNSWTGNSWTDHSWAGNSWTGNSWTGNSWSGNSWTGNSWTGNSWSGNSWTGNSWSGNSWS